MRLILNAIILLTSFLHFSQTESLLDLPNGEIMKYEYLFCDDDNLRLGDINNGVVTKEQYFMAMQNRAYKYLYLLPIYIYRAYYSLLSNTMMDRMYECLDIVINYMRYHEIPISQNLEQMLLKFDHKGTHIPFNEVKNLFTEFKKSMIPLFVFYHKNDQTYEIVSKNEELLKKLDKKINSGVLFKSLLINGFEKFKPGVKYFNEETYFTAAKKLIENIHNEYRIISKDTIRLLDLPNGEIMKNEYLFCDDDNLRLGDILYYGQVTMDQYHKAMQNRAYKYLYILSSSMQGIFKNVEALKIKNNIIECLNYIIKYMKHYEIPISAYLEQMTVMFKCENNKNYDQIENLLTTLIDSIKSLFFFYHKNITKYEMVNGNKQLLQKLDENIKSGLLFKNFSGQKNGNLLDIKYGLDLYETVIKLFIKGLRREYEIRSK